MNPALADSTVPKLFGSFELKSKNISRFPKWVAMLSRFENGEEQCTKDATCDKEEWSKILLALKKESPDGQLRDINRIINRRPYVGDMANWGAEDYWETPFQFLKKSGDCEDYAITKYMALKALGWPAEAMRIVAVRDLHLNIGHAILVVYRNNRPYVLDNQVAAILPADQVRHYKPVYSINELGWWLHGS